MSKPLIVIADMDTAYLAELENKFLVELGDRAELEIISDPEYFEQFFSNPVTAEIVAVNENLYTNALQRQDIQNLFILSEHQEQGRTEELSVSRVYKYYGIKELYNELTYKSQERLEGKESGKRETTIIALYSAIAIFIVSKIVDAIAQGVDYAKVIYTCLLYTSPSPRDTR